jgi:hypothetical protein
MVETFNKMKDWLLIGLLAFLSKTAIDIKNKVYELDKYNITVEYEIANLKAKAKDNEDEDKQQGKDIEMLKTFILPDKILLKNKGE